MNPAEERAARNEALWREVNERIDEVDEAFRVLPDVINRILHGADFLCVFIGDFDLKGRIAG